MTIHGIPMFIGITRQARRDMLKQALYQFIQTTQRDADPDAHVSYEEMQLASVMLQEAKQLQREISAAERLVMADPTHNGD